MFKSIKTKIIMTVMVLFLIGVSVMTAISSTQVKRNTESSVFDSSGALVNEMSYAIENFLGQYEKGLIQLSTSATVVEFDNMKIETGHDPLQALNKTLQNFLDPYTDASGVYFSLPTKQTIIMPYADLGADFDPTTRSWYTLAVAAPDVVQWTSPYIDQASGEFVISASKAVQANGKIIGVVGLDVQLAALSDKIIASEIGYDGYPAVFDLEGTAIVHPTLGGKTSWIFHSSLKCIKEPNMIQFIMSMKVCLKHSFTQLFRNLDGKY